MGRGSKLGPPVGIAVRPTDGLPDGFALGCADSWVGAEDGCTVGGGGSVY